MNLIRGYLILLKKKSPQLSVSNFQIEFCVKKSIHDDSPPSRSQFAVLFVLNFVLNIVFNIGSNIRSNIGSNIGSEDVWCMMHDA